MGVCEDTRVSFFLTFLTWSVEVFSLLFPRTLFSFLICTCKSCSSACTYISLFISKFVFSIAFSRITQTSACTHTQKKKKIQAYIFLIRYSLVPLATTWPESERKRRVRLVESHFEGILYFLSFPIPLSLIYICTSEGETSQKNCKLLTSEIHECKILRVTHLSFRC